MSQPSLNASLRARLAETLERTGGVAIESTCFAVFALRRSSGPEVKNALQVYAVFTQKRDVTQRLKAILSREGICVEVLTAAIPPEAREAWYERQLKAGMQVCLAHPRLVATGLDLLQFPTLLFYESGYSIYVLRQASRRSWRIGQQQPVRVKYMAYAGTMQENCLRLIGKKLLVSLAMEGKFANHGLQALDDDDDMLTAMARELVTQKGVGEKADACWLEVQREHARLLEAQRDPVVPPQEPLACPTAREEPAAPPEPVGRADALIELALPRMKAARKPRNDGDAQLSLTF